MNNLSTHSPTNTHNNKHLAETRPPSLAPPNNNKNVSILCNLDNNYSYYATVIQNTLHVTNPNANDINIVANVVDHIITTQGPKQFLHNSIHAPTNQSILNLSSRDLRHKINSLRHKSKDHHPGFALIYATGIPGQSRIDKLDYVREILAPMTGYIDLTWKFHDQQAAIIIEFVNQSHIQQAI